jgi:hypothetical protein
MAMAASAFPQLFSEVESVEALSWLASVRDFQSLSPEQQSRFLDDLGRRFQIDITGEDWKNKKERCHRFTTTDTVDDLPNGLLPLASWGKLKDISLTKFEACEETLHIRLLGAIVLSYLPPFDWIRSLSEGIAQTDRPFDIREKMSDAIEKARVIVLESERRREQKREDEHKAEQLQLERTLRKAAEMLEIKRGEIADFHKTFQPTPIDPASQKLLEQFAKVAVKQHEIRYRTDFLNAVETIRDLFLDYRGTALDTKGDPTVKELAETLLSPINLTIIANALGNDTKKHFTPYCVPDRTPVITAAETLGRLYAESAAAKEQLDGIINEESLSVVVAAVVLPIDEVKSFVHFTRSVGMSEHARKTKLQEFSDKIQKALSRHDDIRTVKSLRRKSVGHEESGSVRESTAVLPDWLTTKMADYAHYSCFVDPRDGVILMFSNEDPRIFFEVPKAQLKSPETFDAFFSRALDKAYKAKEYSELLLELINLGLQVELPSNDDQGTRVVHADAQIDRVFYGDVRDIKKLRIIKAQFEEYLGLSSALVEFATEVGFTHIEGSESDETKMRLKDGGLVSIPKVVTREQFDDLANTITTLLAKHNSDEDLRERRERNRKREQDRAKEEITPLEGDKILVIDANILLMWSAPVPDLEDTTFLDVLKAYANQTGSRIWIPARVLYEVLGEVSFLNSENQIERVSIRTYSREISEPVRALINGAAHITLLDQAGSTQPVEYRAKRGAKTNITIVYTPEDLEFFLAARDVGENPRQKESFAQHYLGRDLGDYAITDIIDRFDIPGCQLCVVTADRRYAEQHMPKTARNGDWVTWKRPFSLLYSAMNLCAEALADFPSASESKQLIWQWQDARSEETQG